MGNTIFSAIRNLGTFYFSGVVPWDWTAPQNDNLWRDGSTTLFDPCPAGWRITKSGAGNLSPWNNFGIDPYAAPFFYYINGVKQTASGTPAFVASGRNGRFYEVGSMKAWYPAPGYRGNGGGAMWYVGDYGYSWSSTVSDILGMDLYFHHGGLSPSGRDSRAHGFSVRCVRE